MQHVTRKVISVHLYDSHNHSKLSVIHINYTDQSNVPHDGVYPSTVADETSAGAGGAGLDGGLIDATLLCLSRIGLS